MNVIIAAMAADRVIGVDGKIPWHYPDDLKNFKRKTMNKMIVMGRKTYDSIGRNLAGRQIVVATRQMPPQGTLGTQDVVNFLKSISNPAPVYVVGGEEIYAACLGLVDTIYLSRITDKLEISATQHISRMPSFEKEFGLKDFETLESGVVVELWRRL